MAKPIEDNNNAAAFRTALDVPTNAALNEKYTKPANGIPAADLEADPAGRLLLTATSAAERKQVLGLDQVNNTSDAQKPVSTAQAEALATKMNATMPALQSVFDGGTAAQKAAFQSSVSGAGDVLISQCVPNSSDQSSRFHDEVLQASSSGKTLILPAGHINLSGLSGPIAVSGLALACSDGVSWLDAMSAKYVNLFEVTGGDVDLVGIGLRRWQRPINSSATLGALRMSRCWLRQNRSGVTLLGRTDYPASFVDEIVIDSCRAIDSPGWELRAACNSATITRNNLLRVRRDPAIWDMTGYELYGICLGDDDDAPPEYAQAITQNAIVSQNVIRGVSNDSTNPMFTRGILVAASGVLITNNIITDVSQANGDKEAHGLYTKAQYGCVSDNYLVDGGTGQSAIAIKGKSYGAPIAKELRVHHNRVRTVSGDCPVGLIVYGSSTDVLVEDNSISGCPDGAITVYGSPVRTKVRRNTATDCGGIPFLWVCGDITDCECSGNEIAKQRVPTPDDRARPTSPYPKSGTYQLYGTKVNAFAGTIKAFTITSGGSGYTINGKPNGSAAVALSGGSGGSGGGAYATIAAGVLISVVPMDQGVGWTVAPTVTIPLVGTDGAVIACSGSQASVDTVRSTGKISTFVANGVRVRGNMGYVASNPDATAYECLCISTADSTSGPLIVDDMDVVDNGAWDDAHPFYIVGLSLLGQSIQVGRSERMRLLGSPSGRRMQPWRGNGTATLHRSGSYGTRFHLGPASVDGGIIQPQNRFNTIGNRTRVFVNFTLYTVAAQTYLGTIPGGQSSGAVRITKVTPRFIGSALTVASGTPTVALGTAGGGGQLIAATLATGLGSVTSPVDGTPANDVVASVTDLNIYLTIAGGNINASSSVLCVDIDWTLTA